MFRRANLLVLVLLAAPLAHADKGRKPKAALPATLYPLHATHDGVTIAAEPGDIKEARPDTRLDYSHHGFTPIRIIVTNDTDKAVELDQARINFLSADSNVIHAATDDDLQRRLFSTKSIQPTRIPLGPMSIPITHKQVDKQILQDDDDFGFQTTTVAPHSTVAGYLYYDTRDLDDPVLVHATLLVRRVRFSAGGNTNITGPELEEFSIPLKPTEEAPAKPAPAAKPSDAATTPATTAPAAPAGRAQAPSTAPVAPPAPAEKPDNRPHLIPPPDDSTAPGTAAPASTAYPPVPEPPATTTPEPKN